MKGSDQIILSIESAVAGGSISLLRDGSEIANWIGSTNVSKAEDLLANIVAMLVENGISRNEIDMIAVSAGPGSFTGIRIGLATVLGLKAGLGIAMSSQSALKAMAFVSSNNKPIAAAVPVGRNAVCVQSFLRRGTDVLAIDEPRAITELELIALTQFQDVGIWTLHSSLYAKVNPSSNIINFGDNLALAIAHTCRENVGKLTKPLFISKSF
jgi:tRNA threonylcarbamoyl adenosine modification protein YeaZ